VEFLHGDSALARAKIQADDPSQSPALMDYSVAAMNRYNLVEGDPAKGEHAGLITAARMSALLQTLVDLKILDGRPALDDFVSFDFLPAELKAAKT
jgi:NitT/TauT family transport system substrate-binding protein